MTEAERERAAVGKLVHEMLSRANITAYLDMPDDIADKIAVAVNEHLKEGR